MELIEPLEGTSFNKNTKLVEAIKAGIEKKGGHCPCNIVKNEDTICPCLVYRETKHCHCQLYVINK